MRIGVPKEIKNHEYRVGLTPQSVAELTALGHEVWIETHAGAAVGFADEDYLDLLRPYAEGRFTKDPAGLRHFYDQVCTATPAHLEQLQAMGLLRQPPLDLDAAVARHFPDAGKMA